MSNEIEELEALTPTGHHVTGSSGHEVHHGPTDRGYIAIALFLAVVTGAEVALSYWQPGALFLPLLLIMMVVKFFTVVLFFMHLRFDSKLFAAVFYVGLAMAVAIYLVTLSTFHMFSN